MVTRGNRTRRPTAAFALRRALFLLWIRVLIGNGITPPGRVKDEIEAGNCLFPGCDLDAEYETKHGGHCPDHKIVWTNCPMTKCDDDIVRRDKGWHWHCPNRHLADGVLCPYCGQLGELPAGGKLWQCRKVPGHQFYIAEGYCPDCDFGRLVTRSESEFWRCEYCDPIP
ncbi:hypothetical protein SAMN05443668_1011249 [Cryptosporangium aurantiacum]|uniref:Uncharacterized protein n=1 Tax=Cryptosporangium aurantiacum TaxID=134849 RepID=A0A1M7KU89_9ACTN|nr:hypothetical protein SAMN05443668_1011249 [Cryptosporangium aurantiacum]